MDTLPQAAASSRSIVPLSRRLWDIDWSKVFPCKLTEDVTVESVPFEGALPFIEQHYAQIFGAEENGARFLASPMTEAKRRFCEESDVFLFRTGTQTVGLLMGNPID